MLDQNHKLPHRVLNGESMAQFKLSAPCKSCSFDISSTSSSTERMLDLVDKNMLSYLPSLAERQINWNDAGLIAR